MPEIIFNGPEGRLEGRYHHCKVPNAPIALMLHPNPQNGGTMNNKVVYTLYHIFVRQGFSVLRFNFRGVGRSQGQYDRGEGELSDAAAALDWLQTYNQNAGACWIGGFSFGGWIGMQLLMRRPEIEGFITVSPPADKQDFNFLQPCPSSGLLINGDKDEVVAPDAVKKLSNKLSAQKDITVEHQVIPGGDHFYKTSLSELEKRVEHYLIGRLAENAGAATGS